MVAAIARALTMIAVVLQSYFNWNTTDHDVTVTDIGKDRAYHLAGLVLARGGSKGIPKKNLAEVNGQPLIGRALNAMVESGAFTSIWVSTDDEDISNWVRKHYTKDIVHLHKRAAYTATDSATSMSAVLEFLALHPEIDAIGLVQATSPFIHPKYLKTASNLLLKGSIRYDSVFSATKSHQLRWSVVDPHSKSSYTVPINFKPNSRPRRQDWVGEVVENGMFYFAFRHVLVNYQVFQSDKSGYVEIPKHLSMEVDTVEDLEIAECLAKKFDNNNDGSINTKPNKKAFKREL